MRPPDSDIRQAVIDRMRMGAELRSTGPCSGPPTQCKLNKTGGLTGGFQGLPGTIAGLPYVAGGFTDKLLESFAGPHDFLGSLTAYDRLGNLVEGMTSLQRAAFEFQTDIDIPLAAPIAAATVLGQYGLDWSVVNGQKTKAGERK
jgi:filamentous hemagglutinin